MLNFAMINFANLPKILSRGRAWIFLVVYLGLIPLFAIVYCSLPGQQFYAPYAKFEPSAARDTVVVADNIRGSIAESVRTHFKPPSDWQISPLNVLVRDLAADPSGRISFTVAFLATRYANGRIIERTSGPQLIVIMDEKRIILFDTSALFCHPVTISSPGQTTDPFSPNPHLLFRPSTPAIALDAVCWGSFQDEKLRELLAGWTGDPRMLTGYLGRMLYFSATTITTVGFGDIVPLSGTSRLLVGIEAIAGWVLAGFFLNAVASPVRRFSGTPN